MTTHTTGADLRHGPKRSAAQFLCRFSYLCWNLTYVLISRQAVALNAKSGDSHLEDLDGALRLFKRLAELDFV